MVLGADEVIRSCKPKPRRQVTGFQLEQRDRRRRALELRGQGWTFEQIADELGWASASGASYAVGQARKDRRAIEQELAAEVRDMHYEQLTTAFSRVWPVALGGRLPNGEVAPLSLKHMKMGLSIMRDMSELYGLVPPRGRRSPKARPARTAQSTVAGAGRPIVESPCDVERSAEAVRRASSIGRDHADQQERRPPVGYIDPRLRVDDEDSEPEPVTMQPNSLDPATGEPVFDPRVALGSRPSGSETTGPNRKTSTPVRIDPDHFGAVAYDRPWLE